MAVIIAPAAAQIPALPITDDTYTVDYGRAAGYTDQAQAHMETAKHHADKAAESYDRCGDDGFVSQWADTVLSQEARLAAEIAAAGGRAKFPALFDLDGNLVAAKLITVADRYNYGRDKTMWGVLVTDDPRSKVVQWINAFPARKSTMTRKGYTEGYVFAPAKAELAGSGTGLASAHTVRAVARRTDNGFSRDVEIIETCWDYDRN